MALHVSLLVASQTPHERVFTNVRKYKLTDMAHTLFEMSIHVLVPDASLSMATLVGQSATAYFEKEPFFPSLQGIVRTVKQHSAVAAEEGLSLYEIVIVPPQWLLSRRTDHRIFQHKTPAEIVTAVLAGYGPSMPAPRLALTRDDEAREYVVQYGETDLDFVFRILADAGIGTRFVRDEKTGSLQWSLFDDSTICPPRPLVAFIPPAGVGATPEAGGEAGAAKPHVFALRMQTEICASLVTLGDYDYLKPAFPLQQGAPAKDGKDAAEPETQLYKHEAGLEQFAFEIGRWTEERRGARRAQDRLEAARVSHRIVACRSSFFLPAGAYFDLTDHPRDDANGDLFVMSSVLEGETHADGTATEQRGFVCLPAKVPYRPAPRSKPRIHSTQVAKVVCAPGQEIDVDKHGRVEVEFPWDRRQLHQSGICRRVRVSQAWAGAGYGFWTSPRAGDEVVIAYLDGDPDEPLIVGRLNNAVAPPAFPLPERQTSSWWKSRSTPGGEGYNAIAMDDELGAEELYIRAERDFVCDTKRNALTKVGNNGVTQVGGSSTLQANNILLQAIGSGGEGLLSVVSTGDMLFDTAASRTDNIAVNWFVNAGSIYTTARDVVQFNAPHAHFFTPDFKVAASEGIKLVSGGSSIEITPGGIKITSAGPVQINGAFITLN